MNKKSFLVLAVVALISTSAHADLADLESNFYLKVGVGAGRPQSPNDTFTNSEMQPSTIWLGSASIGAYLSPIIRLEVGGIMNSTSELTSTGVKATIPDFKKEFNADVSHAFNIHSGFIKAYIDFSFDEGKFFIFGGPLMSRITETVKYKFVPSTTTEGTTPAPIAINLQTNANTPSYITGAIGGVGIAFPVADDVELHIEGNYKYYGSLPVISEAENSAQVIAPVSTVKPQYNLKNLIDITGTASLVLNLN